MSIINCLFPGFVSRPLILRNGIVAKSLTISRTSGVRVLPRCSSGKKKEENGNPWDIHGNIFHKWSCFFWKNSISLEDFKADGRILRSDEWISSWDEVPEIVNESLQNELERSSKMLCSWVNQLPSGYD